MNKVKKDLQQIQDRLKNIGSTNRSRWASFSIESTINEEKFLQKLKFYGFDVSVDLVSMIWEILGITGKRMEFQDFVKLLQFDVDSISKVLERSISESSKTAPCEYNNEEGDVTDGHIESSPKVPFFGKVDSGKMIHSNMSSIISRCMAIDMKMRGEITLRSFIDICEGLGIDTQSSGFDQIVYKVDPHSYGLIPYFEMASLICLKALEEDTLNEEVIERSFEVDPKPKTPIQLKKQEEFRPIERDMDQGDLIKSISKYVNNSNGGAKSVFSRWKGCDSRLSTSSLHQGLSQDAKIDVPLLNISSIIQQYGNGSDSIALPSFMRMINDGSVDLSTRIVDKKMTIDDQAIYDIARQIHNDQWETFVFKANSADDIVRAFCEMGVSVDDATIRRLTSRLGRIGLIDAIKMKTKK